MRARPPLQIAAGILALLAAAGLARAQEEGAATAPASATSSSADGAESAPEATQVVSLSTDDPKPYYLRVSQGLAHDDNLFRVSSALGTQSDWISSTALLAGFDQPFGRQRAYADATLRGNAYRDQSQLNNFGYDLGLGLNWSTVERISGDLRMNISQSLARFSDYGSAPREDLGKNEENSQFYAGRVQYGVTADWAVDALAEYFRVDFTADDFDSRERNVTTVGAGVKYRPNAIWSFGVGGRHADGTYPRAAVSQGVVLADDYTRDSVDVTARLVATGLSTFSGRLSYTREEHDLDTSRDFSGLTGAVTWTYQATGKVNVGLSFIRDTGTNTSTNSLTGVQTFLTDSRLTNRLGATVRWDATSKIRVTAGVEYWRDTFDDQFTEFVDGGEVVRVADETANNVNLSLRMRYQPTRTIGLECGGRYEDRDGYGRSINPQNGFTATTLFCNATLTLRG